MGQAHMGLFLQSGSGWGIMLSSIICRSHTLKLQVKGCPEAHRTNWGKIKDGRKPNAHKHIFVYTHTYTISQMMCFHLLFFTRSFKNKSHPVKREHVWFLLHDGNSSAYSHTYHAVEGEILNSFLVWTQRSSTKWHGGVERRQTRTATKGEREYSLNTVWKRGTNLLLKPSE